MSEPSRIPAHIIRVAERASDDMKALTGHLNALAHHCRTDEAARELLAAARVSMSLVSTGLTELRGLVEVGKMPQIGVIQSPRVDADKLELHPRQLLDRKSLAAGERQEDK